MGNSKGAANQYNNARLWQIGFFSLNNCATNIAMFLMMQYSYFTQNVLGLAAAIIGLIATGTRIFDAITDPLVGVLVDRTNGRFGKFRPYMLIGNVIIWASLIVIFNTPAHWSIHQKYLFKMCIRDRAGGDSGGGDHVFQPFKSLQPAENVPAAGRLLGAVDQDRGSLRAGGGAGAASGRLDGGPPV